jgi:3-oxoacyl-(acyl-carrier-protein) synthase
MLRGGFAHPSLNCEDVHPKIEPWAASIPHGTREMPGLRTIIKSGFGFGDVNACVIFRRWAE